MRTICLGVLLSFGVTSASSMGCGSTETSATGGTDSAGGGAGESPGTKEPGEAGEVAEAGVPPGKSTALGPDYLLHYEAGGFADPTDDGKPLVCAGLGFSAWPQLLAPTKLDRSSQWPSSLARYRVIAFAFLGNTTGHGLEDAQTGALVEWIKAGGTALFVTDRDYNDASRRANTALNGQLEAMKIGIRIDGETRRRTQFGLELASSSPLSAGVGELTCGAAPHAMVSAPAVALDASPPEPGKAFIAMQQLGSGRVVVVADSTCLADYYVATGTPPTYEDCALSPAPSAAVAAFLKALGK